MRILVLAFHFRLKFNNWQSNKMHTLLDSASSEFCASIGELLSNFSNYALKPYSRSGMNIVSSHATHAILSIFPPISAVPVQQQQQQCYLSSPSSSIIQNNLHGFLTFLAWWDFAFVCLCLSAQVLVARAKRIPESICFCFSANLVPDRFPFQVVDGKLHDFICQRFAVVALAGINLQLWLKLVLKMDQVLLGRRQWGRSGILPQGLFGIPLSRQT